MVNLLALLLAAQAPVPAALVRAPVRVEVVTIGQSVLPAEAFRITADLTVDADDQPAADALMVATRAKIEKSVAALGGHESPRPPGWHKLDTSDPDMSSGIAVNETMLGAIEGVTDVRTLARSNARLNFDAPDLASASRIIAALKKAGLVEVTRAVPLLLDDRPGLAGARDDALRASRLKAEGYARTLGLHVVALRGVHEAADVNIRRLLEQPSLIVESKFPDMVITRVQIAAEYEIAP
ncbi:SIMPL domain-containing protein [Sphingomonas sp. AR_OL41]|uniref:SIMPL domain-containing protein n=1 Tax=Sphingomonas sp. AR_OL41 TaxID=3042729 RepID=UPI0024806DFD|nr:SIMPL domain-containing protein [Sphingomonas sp. AR_OL41]MDH7974778.1 SIMPL domain-containing protein [Sphingomonas sp. AR_OL41]